MQIDHIPLLQIQRELHDQPRDMARFRTYLRTIFGGEVSEENDLPQLVPLIAMNPMGRAHVAERLEQLLALDAEAIAAAAVAEAQARLAAQIDTLPGYTGDYKHGLVIIDDLGGAWSNRFAVEVKRFAAVDLNKYRWFTTGFFVSDEPSVAAIRQGVLSSIYRTLYLERHGPPRTLREMLVQEGTAALFAEIPSPLAADDLAYSRAVLQPYLDSDHYPTCMAAIFGDEAARTLGYPPLVLSAYAGIGVALADFGEGGNMERRNE